MLGYRIKALLRAKYANIYMLSCRNFKMKKKKAGQTSTSIDKALDHFDLYYSPVYQKQWSSIRIALLTTKKSAAVMNNFAGENKYETEFTNKGAYDMVERALQHQRQIESLAKTSYCGEDHQEILSDALDNAAIDSRDNEISAIASNDVDAQQDNSAVDGRTSYGSIQKDLNGIDTNHDDRTDLDSTNLHGFIPAKTVYSETETLRMEEARQNIYSPMDIKMNIVKSDPLMLPERLKVLAYPGGDVSEFAEPKTDHPGGHLCFYMLDAASVLPVIALDLKEGDDVLDLCAAPGGKSLSILQTRLPGSLTCNDISGSRVSRLLDVLQYYIPEDHRQHVLVTRKPGSSYTSPDYDKVLVDVPCNTDRHVLLENDNNLFSPKRLRDRLALPSLQADLLMSGIKSCRPGGSVVYSTCTLSPAQNDGIIQQVFDTVWRESSMDIVVEHLGEITHVFQDTFNFHKGCRFGQLVLPSLTSNFGPMYISKIKRCS